MTNQKLSTYLKEMPDFLKPKYLIKRINEEDIEITEEQRNVVLKALEAGIRFVQINNYTLMLNSIKSIDPKWGKHNIPLRPSLKVKRNLVDGKAYSEITNQEEIDAWDYWYGNRLEDYKQQLMSIDRKNETEADDGLSWFFFEARISEGDGVYTEAERVNNSRKKLVSKYGEIKQLSK